MSNDKMQEAYRELAVRFHKILENFAVMMESGEIENVKSSMLPAVLFDSYLMVLRNYKNKMAASLNNEEKAYALALKIFTENIKNISGALDLDVKLLFESDSETGELLTVKSKKKEN